jgi:hypothetical protein
MAEPANPYRAIEAVLREDLEPRGITVAFGRKGRHGHGNSVKAVYLIPRSETFGAGRSNPEVPKPIKTRTRLPMLEICAPEFDDADSMVDLVVDILDEAFHGA